MDKTWIEKPRVSKEYLDGVESFLNFSFEKASQDGNILCPCKKCGNTFWLKRSFVYDHLVCNGFARGYTIWVFHGESILDHLDGQDELLNESTIHENLLVHECDNMRDMLQDAFGYLDENTSEGVSKNVESPIRERSNTAVSNFHDLLRDCYSELYPGCKKFSKLSFMVRLYHIKCMSGWSNKSFSLLLNLLSEVFPEGIQLPKNLYESKKFINRLGLGYEKIHACPNDCTLYWKEKSDNESCTTCGTSRWVEKEKGSEEVTRSQSEEKKRKKKAAKILRYFPLKSGLQRLFMSSKIAEHVRWHDERRNKDGVLRHPADTEAWKTFDMKYLEFASDVRNVRLALASDGFNPFGIRSSSYSMWPVLLLPYNLPPWMCMKQPYRILSMLIPCPKMPGNNIDIYLQPLIDELKELWDVGIPTYDAFRKEMFMLRGTLMWTINDFPGYDNLSGWNTRSKYACPTCALNTCYLRLTNCKKFCFMGHRRHLDLGHKFRYDQRFDGTIKDQLAPIQQSGSIVLEQLFNVNVVLGKNTLSGMKRRRGVDNVQTQTIITHPAPQTTL